MKSTIISIIVAIAIISGAFLLAKDSSLGGTNLPANNVSIIDGKQIIEIRAKGGYQPRKSVARANLPTGLRFDGKGTFDCSLSVRIPSLNISQILSQGEKTDIDLGISKAGNLKGSCGMGMYPFEIEFQS